MTDALLDIRDLSIRCAGRDSSARTLVTDVALTVARGRTLVLLGESGSGKSLTALSVMGLLPHALEACRRSRLLFDGAALPVGDERAMRRLRGRRMAMIFQDPMACLNPFMQVGAQIAETLQRCGVAAPERRRRVGALLREVELPDAAAFARRYPHQLSGGQQQRVMIAMSLAGAPDLLIADEPTSALDATIQAGIVALLRRLQARRGMAMLFITHDLSVAAAVADDVAVMHAGRVVEQGVASAVLGAPRQAYTQRLVSARAALGTAFAPTSGGEPLVAVEDLTVAYPGRGLLGPAVRAVSNVSLRLERGRTLGLLGESGSGKSTLGAAIAGLRPGRSGDIKLFGASLAARGWRVAPDSRRSVQIVFQNPAGALNPRLTVAGQLCEPLHLMGVPHHERLARAAAALEEVGLAAEHLARYPSELSGGQRQRVCIARALLCEPQILICDEVVSALDMTIQVQVAALLKRLQARRGFAMLFIGHDVDMVRWVSDEIAVMRRGEIVDRFATCDLSSQARHDDTKQLLASRLDSRVDGGPDPRHGDGVAVHRVIQPPAQHTVLLGSAPPLR
jgi:peptide/nickel transport system ATP-binding protein